MKKKIRYGIRILLGWFVLHTFFILADGLIDEREKGDVGVILGSTVNPDGTLSERLRKRLDKGVQLYQDSLIGLVVVSGGLGKEGFYEGTKMAEYLRTQGVPGDKIIIDNAGVTTAATACNFRNLNLNPGSVTVVSQYFHIARTKLAFRNEGYAHVKGVHAEYFEARDLYSIIREFFGYYKYLLRADPCTRTSIRTGESASGVDAGLPEKKTAGPEPHFQKRIPLEHGFEIKAGGYEQLGPLETYTLLVVSRNGQEVFKDSSLTEYTFGDTRYPKVRRIGQAAFELLLQVNDRPNRDYLRWLKVQPNQPVQSDRLPLFIAEAANLDQDNVLEQAGHWDGGQVWGEHNALTAYNPILYYEQSPEGLRLDSTLTRTRNKAIYGNFHGFDVGEAIPVPAARLKAFDQEVRRIQQATYPPDQK